MITDPKSLEDWYNVAIRLDNIRTRTSAYQAGNGNASSSHDEWAMQVDHISVETELAIRAMSASERERYIKDGLCFICGEKGHMSGECPKRKKRRFNKGKGRFSRRKEKIRPGRHIRATSDDGDDDSGEENDDV